MYANTDCFPSMHHVRGFIKLLRNQTLHHCGVARLLVELVTRISNSYIKHVYFILKQTHIHRDIHFIYFQQILKGIWNLKLFLYISLDTSVQEIESKFKMEIQLQIMLVLKTFSTNCQCQIKIVTNISRRHLASPPSAITPRSGQHTPQFIACQECFI